MPAAGSRGKYEETLDDMLELFDRYLDRNPSLARACPRWLPHRLARRRLALVCLIAVAWPAPTTGQAPDPTRGYAIEHVSVIPMTSDTVLPDRTVVVRADRVAAICPAHEGCGQRVEQRIDGTGKYLIPALADMHNHFGGFAFDGRDESRIRMLSQNLRQYLMFGVMTVRDPAGGPRTLEARDAIARGELLGPRIFASSGVMDGSPPLFPGPRSFASPASAVDFVRQTAASGYDLVKVYSTLSLEVFDAVMETAQEVGLTVAAHVPIPVPLEHALDRGLRSIEHLTGYDVACAAPEVTMRPVATDIYQGWAWCSPKQVRALAELTARHEVWNVPTLALWDNTVTELDRPARAAGEQERWEHPTTPAGIAWLYDLYGPRERAGITGTRSVRLALVKALSDAGAPLLIGTDVSATGYMVHREMALFVEAGLTPYQALTAATSEPARYLRREGDFGVVAPGARADLVLLDANPLADIGNARAIRGLMIGGKWWTRAMIEAELAALQREYAEDAEVLRRLGSTAVRAGPAQGCDPLGEAKFLCLTATAEDLVAIPGSDWIVLSGELRAVDTRDGTEIPLFSPEPRFDRALYSSCPGPLAGEEIAAKRYRAHGINLRAGASGVHTLYVVHHGSRESVEVFELDARGERPAITWVGCAPSPEGVTGNSVAVLPDHGFALTNFLDRSLGGFLGDQGAGVRERLRRGEKTGEVWEWSPGRGWAKVPGSEGAGPNGIEASPDGKWYYLAEWGAQRVIKLSRGQPNPTRRVTALDFHPDNLRWQSDGSLLVAGQQGTVSAVLSDCLTHRDCSGVATSVASIDPGTLRVRKLVHAYPANDHFAAGTTGLRVGHEIWVGSTSRGKRIARFESK